MSAVRIECISPQHAGRRRPVAATHMSATTTNVDG
jgi:hypothetical protein